MLTRTPRFVALCAMFLAISLASACSEDANNNPPPPPPDGGPNPIDVPSYSVTGSVKDFYTGDYIIGNASITVKGLTPPPTVQATGYNFTIEGIPPSSVFYILSSSPPDYTDTYNQAVEVVDANLDNVTAKVLSDTYRTDLATAFGVTPAPGTGILLAKVVDEAYQPLAGVSADIFYVNDAAPAKGPYFLDANKQAAPGLDATSTSGYVIFYDIPAGNVTVSAKAGSNYTLSMAVSPAAGDTVTLAEIKAVQGPIDPPPPEVSFVNDVLPIFEARGCVFCHSGGGGGRQDGNLSLQGGDNLIYTELTQEPSPNYDITRVNLDYPEQSLILTMPDFTLDNHPNTTFASEDDPDRKTILYWIQQGALQN